MAVKEVRQCDVFETCKGVRNFGVTIIDDEGTVILEREVDLSTKGFERLVHFIDRGVTKPSQKSGPE